MGGTDFDLHGVVKLLLAVRLGRQLLGMRSLELMVAWQGKVLELVVRSVDEAINLIRDRQRG